jgi:hypothetical protein
VFNNLGEVKNLANDVLQLQLGKDLSVDNGAKEDFRMNLRYARVF